MNWPTDEVSNALAMSAVTGPNESVVLLGRGLFGLSMWDTASAEARYRAVADLGAALPSLTPDELASAKAIIEKEPEEVRQDIRAQLLAKGISTSLFRAIGLQGNELHSGS